MASEHNQDHDVLMEKVMQYSRARQMYKQQKERQELDEFHAFLRQQQQPGGSSSTRAEVVDGTKQNVRPVFPSHSRTTSEAEKMQQPSSNFTATTTHHIVPTHSREAAASSRRRSKMCSNQQVYHSHSESMPSH
eukprot:CAMPEP_0206381450 /NCGR_PEP_ID=MMETSP0294-20121207/12655_1 /ASSEMBLY_ACC=CAM_ASM_000327 /TAXON_ID=39354 /ORGANISM="Heterosigma akashiwo, Strain CCMP2393" /LENGTH=133 /DNA_ID=CAMNT_0053830909 /DNA_START=53 /DNA_END=454 /DNA_ORIENTATION=-